MNSLSFLGVYSFIHILFGSFQFISLLAGLTTLKNFSSAACIAALTFIYDLVRYHKHSVTNSL